MNGYPANSKNGVLNWLISICHVKLFTDKLVNLLFREDRIMNASGRIPLWVVATIAGLGVIVVVGTFFYGSYTHMGSSL